MKKLIHSFLFLCASSGLTPLTAADNPSSYPSWSGIYPHLAMFNDEKECGVGAVVPWADRLWAVTYAPHAPKGSSDKLYEITSHLDQIIHAGVGGTPANRMIHRESSQLFIGPYVIDENRAIRTIPPDKMYGRLTANARHLTSPESKIYFATMEEGLYEVDVHSLDVKTLFHDEQIEGTPKADLPGYHGKGLYSGQGQLIYSNNGEHGKLAQKNPETPSGCLASWDGIAEQWTMIWRKQFVEITGPGGIYGNSDPVNDPVWSLGWDNKSVLLTVMEQGKWTTFRLPKASHSYDGAHGWNTEWPRIREIGENEMLMTMHGMLWAFPPNFSSSSSSGIRPRSSYLKVVGDFCRWNDRVVFGCDDTAASEFLNKRKAKGEIPAPQSQSNLWFVPVENLDRMGPILGRGAIWLNQDVRAQRPSYPYLISGFAHMGLHLTHEGPSNALVTIEVDVNGDSTWTVLRKVGMNPGEYQWIDLSGTKASWVRLRSNSNLEGATAFFHFRGLDPRTDEADSMFDGLATSSSVKVSGGVVRANNGGSKTVSLAARNSDGPIGVYELGSDMVLRLAPKHETFSAVETSTKIPAGILHADDASVIFIDENGKRYRIPRGHSQFTPGSLLGSERVCREVATERDLFNCFGTFFELPAENAGGFSKIRPVTTHNRRVKDFCSYRGLLVMSGIDLQTAPQNTHIIRSDDGATALWVGAIDDIWKMGKPVGIGGPWMQTSVRAGEPSDPYLLTGYDKKTIRAQADRDVRIKLEVDINGDGLWKCYREVSMKANETWTEEFPAAFSAYWIRAVADQDALATVQLEYR